MSNTATQPTKTADNPVLTARVIEVKTNPNRVIAVDLARNKFPILNKKGLPFIKGQTISYRKKGPHGKEMI